MEYIYFSRPDSNLDGINVHTARKTCGKTLFEEAPVEADLVIGVPDSSISAAIGYSEASGIPYQTVSVKVQLQYCHLCVLRQGQYFPYYIL